MFAVKIKMKKSNHLKLHFDSGIISLDNENIENKTEFKNNYLYYNVKKLIKNVNYKNLYVNLTKMVFAPKVPGIKFQKKKFKN